MGTWRRPKGTYVRNTADWNTANDASVGGYFAKATGIGIRMDLYNDASDGSCLHLYKMWVNNDADGIYSYSRVKGHAANFMQQGVPVVIGASTPPGQLYYETFSSPYGSLPTDTPLSDAYFFVNNFGIFDTVDTPGPIAVVTPGYSFRVSNLLGTGAGINVLCVSFYYTFLPDQG